MESNINPIVYRTLMREEISKFAEIDRSEIVQHIYVVRDGALILTEAYFDIPDWSPAEKQSRITQLQELFDRGAAFFAAFDETALVSLAVLDHHFIKSGVKRLNMEILWVSSDYRGQGIGRTLFQWAAQEAFKLGAYAVYVSATPSENTVQFYQNLGCRLAKPVDPDLFKKEPEDIHLELRLFSPYRKLSSLRSPVP